jgi:hypothetical protein
VQSVRVPSFAQGGRLAAGDAAAPAVELGGESRGGQGERQRRLHLEGGVRLAGVDGRGARADGGGVRVAALPLARDHRAVTLRVAARPLPAATPAAARRGAGGEGDDRRGVGQGGVQRREFYVLEALHELAQQAGFEGGGGGGGGWGWSLGGEQSEARDLPADGRHGAQHGRRRLQTEVEGVVHHVGVGGGGSERLAQAPAQRQQAVAQVGAVVDAQVGRFQRRQVELRLGRLFALGGGAFGDASLGRRVTRRALRLQGITKTRDNLIKKILFLFKAMSFYP